MLECCRPPPPTPTPSLQSQPFPPLGHRLDVLLIKAKDLPRMDYFGLCDPYMLLQADGVSVKRLGHALCDPYTLHAAL